MAYIEIRNLTKSYGNRIVLDDISLQMDKGEIMAVVGPSGTGKSTFLRIMCGIVKEDVGEVYVDGTNILERPLDKRNILMMFQNFELFPHLNVWDNIAFGLKAKKIAKEEIEKKFTYFLKLISLENRKDAYPNELSGGGKTEGCPC